VPALRELQTRFSAALFEGADAAVQEQIVAAGISAAERIDIYRNNLREGFIKALAIGFPVIEKLVGEEYFRQLALDFLSAHPSRAGNLHHIGAPFPAFLRTRFAETEYAYLADVAALEWACEEALIAPDAAAISAENLREIDPAHYEDLRFDLHPACALVQSPYPIVHIWRANQPDAASDDPINLAEGGDNVLVARVARGGIELHQLPAAEFAVLQAFASGRTLGEALEAAQGADPAFDLGAALRRFLSLNILVGLH
jgi:hypothetical protein